MGKAVGLATLLLLFAAACIGAAPKSTLRVTWWGSQERHERTLRALREFEAENPGVAVDDDFLSWSEYWTKLTTLAAGGNLPDVMQQDYQYLTEWMRRGLVIPLDDFLDRGIMDFSDVAASALEGGRVGGRLYGASLGVNSTCIMIDADAFRSAGVALPPDTWTWTDFERICLAVSKKLGKPAMSGNIVHDHIWKSLYLGKDLWAYAADGRTLGYPALDDGVFARHMDMAKRLIAAGANIPYGEIVAARTRGVEDDWIVKGRSAMTFMWSNQVVAAWTAAGAATRRFELRPLPRLSSRASSSNYLKPSMFFSVTKNARDPATAAKLIDFFTNSIPANRMLLAERGVPIAEKVREALKPLLAPPQRAVFDYLTRIQKDAAPIPPPDPVGNTDLISNSFIPLVVDPVMFGVISADEGMRRLRAEAERTLGR
jgi:multiple sugar transport system substrate-binding protein